MYRRLSILFTLLLALSLGGLGCKEDPAVSAAAAKPFTLNFWTVFDDVGALQTLATQYQAIRPYVTVNIRQVRYEEFDKLFTNALADDVGPDVVSMHVRWLGKYQSRLLPMPPTVKVASFSTQGTFAPETVVTVQTQTMPTVNTVKGNYISTVGNDVVFGNQVYGLPLALDTLALYYNKDLLDRAGIALPPTSWTEFVDAVKKTTKFDQSGNITQYGVALGTADNVENMSDIFSLLVMQNGLDVTRKGQVLLASGLDSGVPLQSQPTYEALKFYTDFARPTKDVYSWNDKPKSALEEFVRGRAVFYFGFAYDMPRIKARAPQMNLEVIPVPQLSPDPNKASNVANYWVQSVVKKTKHPNEAWDFIRFLSQPANIKKYTDATKRPTPLRSQFDEQRQKPEMAPFVNQLLFAKNWYTGRNVDAATDALKSLIRGYLAPYGADSNPSERDGNLILNAARAIQQTM